MAGTPAPVETVLVDQPVKKPVRKLRVSAMVLAVLTIGTYAFGAVEGNEIIDQDTVIEAVKVLLAGGLPWLAAYLAKAETTEAGE